MARALLLAIVVLTGCGNPCQDICVEMSRYADDCGLTVDRDALLTCRDAQAEPTEDELGACQEWSDPDTIREWWSCEDLAENYENGGSLPAR